ncbi:MAG: arginine--tRNA ligase [Planctomycetota bacterium]
MNEFTDRLRAAIAEATGLAPDDVKLERPRDASMGDLAFPCFPLAKTLRKAPPKIAAELAERLAQPDISVVATGPYLNFRIERGALARSVVGAVLRAGNAYGGSDEGAGKTIVIDFSSPNIAKPMHVGHLRSTILGAAIKRLHDHLGYRTVGINHLGDWGSQFGKLIAALERWGDTVDLEAEPIRALLALYVRYHEESDADPSLEARAREAFRELESGEEGDVRATWRRLTELSLREFQRVYDRLGVSFDHFRGEAWYEDKLDATVDRIVAAGVTDMSDGALIVDLEAQLGEGSPPCLLRKSDGTTLYATRDLAALFSRFVEFEFERCLYVVGSEQRLHFRQLKAVLERMGLDWEPRVEHVDFGLLRLAEGRLSTREGKVIFLDELLDRARAEALAVIAAKNPELPNKEEIAEQVGIGAVIFHDLKKERVKDVVFDWQEVLSFSGDTGPYCQWTHARLGSIVAKGEAAGFAAEAEFDAALLADADQLLLAMGGFGGVVRQAAREAEPSVLASWVADFAREVNRWYVDHRVVSEDEALSRARLALVRAAAIVINTSLGLLGVAAPARM